MCDRQLSKITCLSGPASLSRYLQLSSTGILYFLLEFSFLKPGNRRSANVDGRRQAQTSTHAGGRFSFDCRERRWKCQRRGGGVTAEPVGDRIERELQIDDSTDFLSSLALNPLVHERIGETICAVLCKSIFLSSLSVSGIEDSQGDPRDPLRSQ
ncbi:hypothetical protein BT69DRAFT_871366 [Atractiella rhizophila]|nr:hypothetical protein BT69DRAFT_871366 [Atractiella rhizophila]